MNYGYIDGNKLRQMFSASAHFLEKNKQSVNALERFSSSGWGHGTNMALTMMAAVKKIQKLQRRALNKIADAAAKRGMKRSTGNSGVILSQLLRDIA